MTTYNRERSQGAEQGRARRINTDDGQQTMEEVRDSNGKLIGYRPVAESTAQSTWQPAYEYNLNLLDLQNGDPDIYERALRGHELAGERLRQQAKEAQDARDLAAFDMLSRGIVPQPPTQRPQMAAVYEATSAPNVPVKKNVVLQTYPEGHDLRGVEDKDTSVKTKNNEKVRKRFNAKTIIALGAGGVILAGGGVFAIASTNGNVVNATIDGQANVPAVDPELIPNLTATPLVEAFGGCMDEKGGGSVLGTGSVKSETASVWMMGMKGPNGNELKAEFGKEEIVYPKVQLESDVDYTACVVAANVANVVSLDVNNPAKPIATINLDLIDPQVRGSIDEDLTKIKRGWSSTDFEPKMTIAEELMKGGVDQGKIPADVATNFIAAYNDAANAGAEVLAAEKATIDTIATDGSAESEKLKVSILQKIKTSIKEKVKRLAQDKLAPSEEVEVNFTGKLKGLLAKNQPAPKADRFTVSSKSIIKDFTVNADQTK